jgi:hypothetical protein
MGYARTAQTSNLRTPTAGLVMLLLVAAPAAPAAPVVVGLWWGVGVGCFNELERIKRVWV